MKNQGKNQQFEKTIHDEKKQVKSFRYDASQKQILYLRHYSPLLNTNPKLEQNFQEAPPEFFSLHCACRIRFPRS